MPRLQPAANSTARRARGGTCLACEPVLACRPGRLRRRRNHSHHRVVRRVLVYSQSREPIPGRRRVGRVLPSLRRVFRRDHSAGQQIPATSKLGVGCCDPDRPRRHGGVMRSRTSHVPHHRDRRQSKSWMFGLPFAAAVSWAAQFGLYQHPGRSYRWEPWTAFVGTFVVGCLICWAFDLLGRRLRSRGEAPGS
jgi:hypothetical protein